MFVDFWQGVPPPGWEACLLRWRCCHSLASAGYRHFCLLRGASLVLQPVFPRLLSKSEAPCLLSHLCVDVGWNPVLFLASTLGSATGKA